MVEVARGAWREWSLRDVARSNGSKCGVSGFPVQVWFRIRVSMSSVVCVRCSFCRSEQQQLWSMRMWS